MSGIRMPLLVADCAPNALSNVATAGIANEACEASITERSRVGSFDRQHRRKAVAELRGIGPHVPARRTGVRHRANVVVAVSAAVGHDVEERLRLADREPRPLDEGAVPESTSICLS